MKKQPLAWLAVATLTAGTALAQDNPPPAPPAPPAPPHAAGPPADHQGPPPDHQGPPPGGGDGMQPGLDGSEHGRLPRPLRGGPGRHHEPGLLLGVGVEEVPHALSDQLSLPDGFGVLVNFVVPGSAAEAAGVQPDDVLKMLNDQILVNPEQLSTLVRSYSDGQEVTLTAIRKDKEVKLTAKLKKEPLPAGRERFGGPGREGEGRDFDREGEREHQMHEGNEGREQASEDRGQAYRDLGQAFADGNRSGPPGPPPPPVREIMRELRPELKELGEAAANQKQFEKLQREITILRERDGGSRSTKLDLQDARIVIRDDKGELELKSDAGKRSLTAKDPQGKVLFSGPVNTPDERKAVPGDILPRLEKLEKEEMPAFPEAPKADAAGTSQNTTPGAPLSAATF